MSADTPGARGWLVLALLALAALYGAWFAPGGDWTALVVFALPPVVLAALVWVRPRVAQFTAGVLALLWFSHGVMAAWSEAGVRALALGEIALAVMVIVAANWDGLRARVFRRKD